MIEYKCESCSTATSGFYFAINWRDEDGEPTAECCPRCRGEDIEIIAQET